MKNNTNNKNTEKAQKAEKAVKEIKTIDAHLKAEKKTGFYFVQYTDKIKNSEPQNLKACVMENGLIIFSNRNFSTTADHALVIAEECKPFAVKVRKGNIERHAKIHGNNSPVLKAITDSKLEVID